MRLFNQSRVVRVMGAPGTGKTTWIQKMVQGLLRRGVPPERIAFVSFTRQAIKQMKLRCSQRDVDPSQFSWFKTIHSISRVIARAHVQDCPVMTAEDYEAVCREAGFNARMTTYRSTGSNLEQSILRTLQRIYELHQVTGADLYDLWEAHTMETPIPYRYAVEYMEAIESYKEANRCITFHDMLLSAIESDLVPPLDYVFVDEAQDLSITQWQVVQTISSHAKCVWVVGDPNQAIFQWAGSSNVFDTMEVDEEKTLGTTYRLPVSIHALSQNLATKLYRTIQYAPVDGREGVIRRDAFDWAELGQSPGRSILVLARNGYALRRVAHKLAALGIPYHLSATESMRLRKLTALARHYGAQIHVRETMIEEAPILPLGHRRQLLWEEFSDFDYFRCIVNKLPWYDAMNKLPEQTRNYIMWELRGFKLPVLSTFHGSKGAEADIVIVLPDLTATQHSLLLRGDKEELCALYVAITRSKHELWLAPITRDNHRHRIDWSMLDHDFPFRSEALPEGCI